MSSIVAPFTGAWVETAPPLSPYPLPVVAPFTGAWVETIIGELIDSSTPGRPLHGGVG